MFPSAKEVDEKQLEKQKSDQFYLILFGSVAIFLFLIAALLPMTIAIAVLLVGYFKRWPSRWLILGGLLGVFASIVFGFFADYYSAFLLLLGAIGKANGNSIVSAVSDVWFKVLIGMFPASLGIGSLFGGILLWIAIHRPKLLRLPIQPPETLDELKKTVDFNKLKKLPQIEDGVILGLDTSGNEVYLRDYEANMHVFVSGATGAGKTNTLRVVLESAIRRNKPVIIVDGKGDPGFLQDMKAIAEAYGRKFQGFSYKGYVRYNPLRHGDATELKDKLVAIEEWTEPYYKRAAERYLQLVFRVLKLSGDRIDLHTVQDMLIQKNLMEKVKKLKIDREVANKMKEYINSLDEGHRNAVNGLKDRIALLTESDIGHLFRDEEGAEVIDLLEAVLDRRVVMMSLSGLSYSSFTPALGAMIVEDLKSVANAISEMGRRDYVYVVLDEFNLFAGEQVVNMINKSRSAGFCCFIATQELADLSSAGGPELIGQVIGNTNVKIIHRQDVPDSAEYLANVVGTKHVIDQTYIAEDNLLGNVSTGRSSVTIKEDYRLHPNVLKNLRQGQAVVIKKIPNNTVQTAFIRPAPEPPKQIEYARTS